MAQKRRLDKVEHSLSPKQAMHLWLEEAQQHGSFQGYAHWLKEQPDSAYPLSRLPRQVRQAVQEARKGQPREQITAAVQRAERDVIFLFKLFMGVNARVLAARKEDALGYLWLLERLRRLWDAAPRQLREDAATWREHALPLAAETYALATAIEDVAQRYFGGLVPLFPAEAEGVAQATEGWDALLAMYADQLGRLPAKQQRALALTRETARAAAQTLAQHNTRYLVAQAKAEMLRLLGDYEGAALLVEPYL